MLHNISTTQFLTGMIFLVILYYLVILLTCYRQKLQLFLKGRLFTWKSQPPQPQEPSDTEPSVPASPLK